jgi:hypothetical protein
MNCVAQHAIGVKKGPHDFAILKWLRGEKTHLFSICCKRSLRIYVCASLLDPVEMNAILLPKHIKRLLLTVIGTAIARYRQR